MWYPLTRFIAAPLARLACRPLIEGRHHVPQRGAFVLASNHLSFLDSVVLPLFSPRRVAFLAKAEYFEDRSMGGRLRSRWFTALGAVPVRRGASRAAHAALDSALEVLAAGEAFGIYPEGTRSRDGRLYRGRTGVAWLALTAAVPVVPVALAGTQRLLPVGSRVPRPTQVGIRFGAPLHFAELYGRGDDARVRRAVTDEIMTAIADLSGQERVPRYNRVP